MRILSLLRAGAFLAFMLPPTAALAVFSADEICGPTVDPCVISSSIEVDNGAFLDFGVRAVQLINAGQLDSGTGDATLRCGSFTANGNTTPAIKARGPNGLGSVSGGFFSLEAYRTCTQDTDLMCISDRGCDFGECNVSTCANNQARICSDDNACDLGTCIAGDVCSGAANFACASDADCQLGTCSITVCSLNRSHQCSTDSDCNAGVCENGSGEIILNRKVRADGFEPGGIFIRAAGDVTIAQLVNVESTNLENDGGIVEIESGKGTIRINDVVRASGGTLSAGGEICMMAGKDIVTTRDIDATGGDFDGGFIELTAENDVLLAGDLNVSSGTGEGFGGEIAVFAERDIIFSGSSKFLSNGHTSAENFGGDGGSQDYTADRNISVGADAFFEANGARPDGSGEVILFEAQGTLTVAGTIRAKAIGDLGSGGAIELTSDNDIVVEQTAILNVDGGSGGGGSIDITGGDMTLDGSMTAEGVSNGFGGTVFLDSLGTLDFGGSVTVKGTALETSNGSIDIEACRMNITSGSLIDNIGGFGTTVLAGRETVSIQSGSQVLNAPTGKNTIFYRDPNKPPTIAGVVTPSPILILDTGMLPCPLCGNAELEQGETCDDGNLVSGDGCDSKCQDEACIAQTPGYPFVPLCDDGVGCTQDTCVNGNCEHQTSCDDGIDCTEDSCGEGDVCVNAPNHSACDDGEVCTVDSCTVGVGCTHAFSNGLCDDDVDCTSNDVCFNGTCSGVSNCPLGEFCMESSGMCVDTTTTTTTTTTTLVQHCGNGSIESPETCDDGDQFWSLGDYCDAGCDVLSCGDADDTGAITATDALFALNVAVGLDTCDLCICDADNSGATTAPDALRLLRRAVGLSVELTCPACPA